MHSETRQLWPIIAPNYTQLVERQLPMAMLGWAYAAHIDRTFLLSKKDTINSNKPSPSSVLQKPSIKATQATKKGNTDLLSSLLKEKNISARWKKLKKAIDANDSTLALDSFQGLSRSQTKSAIQTYFAQKKQKQSLNIVIIGSGPVGLAMASALKLRLHNKARILVIDHRCEKVHSKKPYSRNWVTHLSNQTFEGILPANGRSLIQEFGVRPYAGCTVNTLEGILHLSSLQAGVKFLFDQQYSLDFVSQSDIDLVIDASGGRWEPSNEHAFKPLNLTLPIPNLDGLEDSVKEFGVPSLKQIQPSSIALRSSSEFQGWLSPTASWSESNKAAKTENIEIHARLMKVRNIDFAKKEELLNSVKAQNTERHFYLWPGHLKDEINELLLLVNLDQNDNKVLSKLIQYETKVSELIQDKVTLNKLSQPVANILSELGGEIGGEKGMGEAIIEPPFSFAPRFRHPDAITTHIHSTPVIRAGDSLYNGHPKAGNGLSSHLNFVSQLSNLIAQAAPQII